MTNKKHKIRKGGSDTGGESPAAVPPAAVPPAAVPPAAPPAAPNAAAPNAAAPNAAAPNAAAPNATALGATGLAATALGAAGIATGLAGRATGLGTSGLAGRANTNPSTGASAVPADPSAAGAPNPLNRADTPEPDPEAEPETEAEADPDDEPEPVEKEITCFEQFREKDIKEMNELLGDLQVLHKELEQELENSNTNQNKNKNKNKNKNSKKDKEMIKSLKNSINVLEKSLERMNDLNTTMPINSKPRESKSFSELASSFGKFASNSAKGVASSLKSGVVGFGQGVKYTAKKGVSLGARGIATVVNPMTYVRGVGYAGKATYRALPDIRRNVLRPSYNASLSASNSIQKAYNHSTVRKSLNNFGSNLYHGRVRAPTTMLTDLANNLNTGKSKSVRLNEKVAKLENEATNATKKLEEALTSGVGIMRARRNKADAVKRYETAFHLAQENEKAQAAYTKRKNKYAKNIGEIDRRRTNKSTTERQELKNARYEEDTKKTIANFDVHSKALEARYNIDEFLYDNAIALANALHNQTPFVPSFIDHVVSSTDESAGAFIQYIADYLKYITIKKNRSEQLANNVGFRVFELVSDNYDNANNYAIAAREAAQSAKAATNYADAAAAAKAAKTAADAAKAATYKLVRQSFDAAIKINPKGKFTETQFTEIPIENDMNEFIGMAYQHATDLNGLVTMDIEYEKYVKKVNTGANATANKYSNVKDIFYDATRLFRSALVYASYPVEDQNKAKDIQDFANESAKTYLAAHVAFIANSYAIAAEAYAVAKTVVSPTNPNTTQRVDNNARVSTSSPQGAVTNETNTNGFSANTQADSASSRPPNAPQQPAENATLKKFSKLPNSTLDDLTIKNTNSNAVKIQKTKRQEIRKRINEKAAAAEKAAAEKAAAEQADAIKAAANKAAANKTRSNLLESDRPAKMAAEKAAKNEADLSIGKMYKSNTNNRVDAPPAVNINNRAAENAAAPTARNNGLFGRAKKLFTRRAAAVPTNSTTISNVVSPMHTSTKTKPLPRIATESQRAARRTSSRNVNHLGGGRTRKGGSGIENKFDRLIDKIERITNTNTTKDYSPECEPLIEKIYAKLNDTKKKLEELET